MTIIPEEYLTANLPDYEKERFHIVTKICASIFLFIFVLPYLFATKRVSANDNINTDLAEIQSRLVRILSSDSLVESGLCLAQLPKEYEKNYLQQKVPNPKDYGYRKLIQLLQKKCPDINVTVDAGTKQAYLRVASTGKTV